MTARGSRLATPLSISLLLCTALAIWVVWPAFSAGRIVNLDAPRHLLRSVVMAGQFLPSGHVDGWSPWWYLGAQLFLFQSYGYFFLIGASALLLSHVATIEQVFKAWYVLPVVALPAATALMALRLGVTRRGAAVAALASITFGSSLGYGIQGAFGVGLLLQSAGVLGFAIAWPEILGVLIHRDRSPWRAVVVLAAVLIVHFITGAYALATAGFVAAGLAVRFRHPWPLLRYALVASAVLLIAGHSLFPSLELHDIAGQAVGWGNDRERFDRFLMGTLFGAQPLALAALAAAAWSVRRGSLPLAISAIVLFVTALLGGANEQGWEPDWIGGALDILVRPRALPYAALLQSVFVGFAVDAMLRAGERAAIGRPALLKVGPPLVLAAVFLVAMPEITRQRRFVRTESMVDAYEHRIYRELVGWLRENVKPPAVVAVPRLLFPQEVLGARSVVSFLNLDTGLHTLGGDQAELSKSSRGAGRVELDNLHLEMKRNATALRSAGVSHVIVSRLEARMGLTGSEDFELGFEYEVPERGRSTTRHGKPREPLAVAVYRLRDGGRRLHAPGLRVVGMDHSPERITWAVDVAGGRPVRAATAAVNWHPNWTARVDGVRVPTRASPARYVAFDVPQGAKSVRLEFERSAREKGYNLLSAVTLLLALLAWRRDSRRRVDQSAPTFPERGLP
ncbi:MAG: hypothetical protein ABR587_08550 [Candidatus Binatia bacterium]